MSFAAVDYQFSKLGGKLYLFYPKIERTPNIVFIDALHRKLAFWYKNMFKRGYSKANIIEGEKRGKRIFLTKVYSIFVIVANEKNVQRIFSDLNRNTKQKRIIWVIFAQP